MAKIHKAPRDPLYIYMNAERFRIADQHMRAVNDINLLNSFAPVAIVVSAFASELYLKCLLCIETGDIPQTHNLRELFHKLTPATRQKIEIKWAGYIPTMSRGWKQLEAVVGKKLDYDLESALMAGRSAFVRLRYHYEVENLADTSFILGDFPTLLRAVILEMMPAWAGAHHTPPTSHTHSGQAPPSSPVNPEEGGNQ